MRKAFRLQIGMNEYYRRALAAIDKATQDMTDEELNFHPEGKWSSAEILEHLTMAFAGTAKMFSQAIANGRPLGDVPNAKQRLTSFVVTGLGYFPEGRKAPKHVVPSGSLSGRKAVEQIRADLERLDAMHAECLAKVGERGCVANHPVLGPLTIQQWPRFHWVHTRHHMKQIERLRTMQANGARKASA